MAEIDEADRILLDVLQSDGRVSINDLADRSGLSVPSVQRRLKRLRSEKFIERDIAVLNAAALGQSMAFIVLVELERERLDHLQAFKAMARKEPHVQQCYYVTGEADFILICLTPSMEAFEALTQRLFFANSNVRKFRTSVVMDRTKVGLSVAL
jgi:Lrp/AsnC family transcriptional regulator, leucine-responsive regulatory protein